MTRQFIITALGTLLLTATLAAQVEEGGVVRRNGGGVRDRKQAQQQAAAAPGVTDRMQILYDVKEPHDADLAYMRQIYRELDLTKPANTPLYFPEDIVDGQENLFRIIMRLVVNGTVPAYEYLDGREVYTDQYKINVPDMLDRFDIYYTTEGSQNSRGGARYVIEEADVPTAQVLNYYIVEKWEFDKRTNAMKTRVEAICPVMTRSGDFGGEARYPMFWVKFDALRPHLAQQYIFLSDDNNLAQYSLDDYFNLTMYDGEIYKTRNLRNLSMAQMYPDPDDLKRAQDSIDNRLRNFGSNLWVPTREEYLAMKEKEAEAEALKAESDTLEERTTVVAEKPRATKKAAPAEKKRTSTKKRAAKVKSSSSSSSSNSANSNASKSVRRRKK